MKPSAAAESIAAKDLNNLYLTSRYFADPAKYTAFCSLYALMRVVDDRVDELSPRGELTAEERVREHRIADAWEEAFLTHIDGTAAVPADPESFGREDAGEIVAAAADATHLFPVPCTLWRNFFAAMHRDLDQRPFSSWRDFLDYTEGASVAPTTIYLYLIASRREPTESCYALPAGFDLIGCGRKLGTFAYVAHILRDLAKDVAAGERGLLYLSLEDLQRYGLSPAELREDSRAKRARPALRRLVADLAQRSRLLRDQGRVQLATLDGRLTPDCAFILELIVRFYDAVLDKLESVDFDPMAGRHRLTIVEKARIARQVARPLGFPLSSMMASR